jgi:hypothetical protein
VQRRFATPVPRVADLDELNASLRLRCQAERERIVHSLSGPFKIGARFAEEEVAAAPLPNHPFDACVIRPTASVDKYQTVAFDRNRYSVPRPFAFQMVTVKGYIDRVVIVAAGQVIATHVRSLQCKTLILEPIHYLATLGRKPGALDHAPVYRDWKLPACFTTLRAELEQHHGAEAGARRFVRVLQLLGDHSLDRVRRAVEACQLDQLISAEAIIERTRSFATIESQTRCASSSAPDCMPASPVHVPLPDLNRFNQLLNTAVNRDDAQDKTFTVRADTPSPECRGSVFFAC